MYLLDPTADLGLAGPFVYTRARERVFARMTHGFVARSLLGCILVACAAASGSAGAQATSTREHELAAARETARLGLAALEHQDFASADDLLSRAIAMHDAPTLRLARARARDALGRMLAAAEDYRIVDQWPRRDNEHKAFASARKQAAAELGALNENIPRLVVELQGKGRIRVGGIEWPAATHGTPRLLDPGEYVIEAVAPAGMVVRERVRLARGQHETIKLDLTTPVAKRVVPPVPATAATAPTTPSVAAPVAAARSKRTPSRSPQPALSPKAAAAATPHAKPNAHVMTPDAPSEPNRTPAYVVGGVSAVLLVASVVTGALTLELRDKYDERNRSDVPRTEKDALRSDGTRMATISTVLLSAGLAGAGIAAYLWVAPADEREATAPHAQHTARRLGVQATFTGKF